MEILINVVLLLVGFVLLIKGADYFVEGSAATAKKLKVPGVIIGLTIVAMGTSAPELAVSTTSALQKSNALALSNVIGSNVFNLAVVLGVCALMCPMVVDKEILKRDFPASIIATIIVICFSSLFFISRKTYGNNEGVEVTGQITQIHGVLLLTLFIIYLIVTVRAALKSRETGEEIQNISTVKCVIFILGGIAAIVWGGNLVVDNAKALALAFGMSETLVGLTIVAIGTSLPELVTSIVASRKGENGMAIGNVVGSNIFNLLLILGVSSAINTIPVTYFSLMDILALFILSTVVFIFCKSGKKLGRLEGALMVAFYICYMIFAIIR